VKVDALVVGAGPAGSSTAIQLARGGARVLLADKARFPRDKPCGGGLTIRAVRQLPVSPDPVVEQVVDRMGFRLRYGTRFERAASEPLVLMTQRRRSTTTWSSGPWPWAPSSATARASRSTTGASWSKASPSTRERSSAPTG